MRTLSHVRCARRDTCPDTLIQWARDCVRHPARYGADEHARQIVASLLAQIGAQR